MINKIMPFHTTNIIYNRSRVAACHYHADTFFFVSHQVSHRFLMGSLVVSTFI